MADPLSIISVIEGSLGLILQCGSVAKTLNDIAGKFKQAKLTILSVAQEVDTIELAWTRIRQWIEHCGENKIEDEFLVRLDRSLKCGDIVISALQQDLSKFNDIPDVLNFVQQSRIGWNEKALRDHQHRLRGQVIAMNLLLQVIDMSNPTQRKEFLCIAEHQLSKSDESAYSIVPSRNSSRLSLSTCTSTNSAELMYSQLNCEDDLFTGRVYKRNFKRLLASYLRSRPKSIEHDKDGNSALVAENGSKNIDQHDESSEELNVPQNLEKFWSPKADVNSILNLSILSAPVDEVLRATKDIDSAFHHAARLGTLTDAKILSSWGAQINKGQGTEKWTPLHSAAGVGNERAASFLLEKGAEATTRSSNGIQPVHLASKSGSLALTRLLLAA